MNARTLTLLAVAAVVPLLSGCLTCEPLLEAQHCNGGVGACTGTDATTVHDWNATVAADWPEVDGLLRSLDNHGHLDWTAEKEDAFWSYWGMAGGDIHKDLYVRLDGEVYRIRVLTCD